MEDQPPRILCVAEIVLSVADLPRMRSFYESVTGFAVHSEACHETGAKPEPDGKPTICFLTINASETPLGRNGHPQFLVLIDYQRHVFARSRLIGHDVNQSTLNHLAFEIPSATFKQQVARLHSLGLEPASTRFSNLQADAVFFRDPEGNVLELICHQPAESEAGD